MKSMKSQNGITMIVLAITIIVMMILIGVSLSFGLSSINDARGKNYKAEVNIVGQAVAEQYIKIVELGMEKLTTTNPVTDYENGKKPKIFVGQCLGFNGSGDLDTYGLNVSFRDFLVTANNEEEEYRAGVRTPGSTNVSKFLWSKCYYLLNENDLKELRINAGSSDSQNVSANSTNYIVNYYTGEVLNIKKNEYFIGIKHGGGNAGKNEDVKNSKVQNDLAPSTSSFNEVLTGKENFDGAI